MKNEFTDRKLSITLAEVISRELRAGDRTAQELLNAVMDSNPELWKPRRRFVKKNLADTLQRMSGIRPKGW